jgi:hypothetical protein
MDCEKLPAKDVRATSIVDGCAVRFETEKKKTDVMHSVIATETCTWYRPIADCIARPPYSRRHGHGFVVIYNKVALFKR